jgi:hypothetical protein
LTSNEKKERKFIYISKKLNLFAPRDFQPRSMLEVLYKMPSRIMLDRPSLNLPTIKGDHQHSLQALTKEGNKYNILVGNS